MLRRNVILGGLIAGAFLLPSMASAGVVQGVCSNCHTMHDSQNGTAVNTGTAAGQHASLLKGDGCVGCHADSATNLAVTGKGTGGTGTGAPQVDVGGQVNAGGYFTAAGMATQHNVAGIGTKDTNMTGNIPGSSTAYSNILACSDCHTNAGHHKTTTNVYRMLSGSNQATSAAGTYNPNASFPGDRSAITYTKNMNDVCGGCHPNFHGSANYMSGAAFVRHPTGNVIAANGKSIESLAAIQARLTGTTADAIVISNNSEVLCLSCHVAHGGPNNDLLSFAYSGSGNYAGDSAIGGTGCETCHSYTTSGM